jgi:MFS family permease
MALIYLRVYLFRDYFDWRMLVLKNLFSALLPAKTSPLKVPSQRMHFCSVITIFACLGFHVGVWAVLIADLTNAFKLSTTLLGIALSCFPCAGIVLLMFGSLLADHVTRRFILLVGIGGLGFFFIALACVSHYTLLIVLLLLGGACASCYDLAANTIGGDYERNYTNKTMTLFHAGFSGGAALGAISSATALAGGLGFRTIYAATGILFLLLLGVALRLPLPIAIASISVRETDRATHANTRPSIITLLAIPVVLLATTLVCLSFFTDGALEGFISVYLRNLLGSGALLGGIGIAAFYLTGMIGRFCSTVVLRRYGNRPVITVAALLSMFGMTIALSTTSAPLAVGGLLLVGLGQSPIVPIAFSLAARVGSYQGARAVAIVTAFGYSIFLISPLLIGALAAVFSLRIALLLTIATSLSIVLIAQRLPESQKEI